MTGRAVDRVSRSLLAGSFVFAALATAAAFGAAPAATGWILAGTLLLSLAAVAWMLRRSAAGQAILQAEAERSADRLLRLAAAQTRLVDSLAHEIRTPLTIVQNHAELLLRCSGDPATVRLHGKSLVDYTRHCSGLLEGFLRLGGPGELADTSHHVPVDVHDLVTGAVRGAQTMARSRGVGIMLTIVESGDEAAAVEVLGNEPLLGAMVESIVRHAVRGAPRGSQVELQVGLQGESILLHVRDHGVAAAASDLDSVFDACYPVPGARPQTAGNGGGLAIGRRIAEHHRGTIVLQNHPDGGCEFVVTLPRWRGEGLRPARTEAPDCTKPLVQPA